MKKILEFQTSESESIFVSYDSVNTSIVVIHDETGCYEHGTTVQFDELASVHTIVCTYSSDKE